MDGNRFSLLSHICLRKYAFPLPCRSTLQSEPACVTEVGEAGRGGGGTGPMDAYAAHLAMAALVGASIVAVSAYFVHRKALAQVLEFAREERDRGREMSRFGGALEEEGIFDGDREELVAERYKRRNHQQRSSRRKVAGHSRRGSASLPDVTAVIRGQDDDLEEEVERRAEMNGPLSAFSATKPEMNGLGSPPGLPRLHTLPEGIYEFSDFTPVEYSCSPYCGSFLMDFFAWREISGVIRMTVVHRMFAHLFSEISAIHEYCIFAHRILVASLINVMFSSSPGGFSCSFLSAISFSNL